MSTIPEDCIIMPEASLGDLHKRIEQLEKANAALLAAMKRIANDEVTLTETYISDHEHLSRYYYPALVTAIHTEARKAIALCEGAKP